MLRSNIGGLVLILPLLACSKEAPRTDAGGAAPTTSAETASPASVAPTPTPVPREMNFRRSVMTTVGDDLDVCADTDINFVLPSRLGPQDPTPTNPTPAPSAVAAMDRDASAAWLNDPTNVRTILSDDLDTWMQDGKSLFGDRLDEPPVGKRLHASLARLSHTREKNTVVPKGCIDTLKDRVVLATCSVEIDVPPMPKPKTKKGDDAGIEKPDGGSLEKTSAKLAIVARYYNFGTVGLSDKSMTDCLAINGSWNALDRDSREWAKARLDHDSRKLRRAVEAQ